jgi:NADPH:quinone reductase-like Zn-dependent oxidoreductase
VVGGFDRDFGTYAEQLVVPAADVAVVPDELALIAASTVPLNGLTAVQILDLLGDAPAGGRLLVTGAAGAVGGYVAPLAQDRGWRVTGLARAQDEAFVRGLGAHFTTHAEPGWDAVADAAGLQEQALALVRDGGAFVGVKPNAKPAPERGIAVHAVVAHADGRHWPSYSIAPRPLSCRPAYTRSYRWIRSLTPIGP